MAKWVVSGKKCDFKGIGDRIGIDQVVVRLLRNRDICDEEQMKRFLNPSVEDEHEYYMLKDMDDAVNITLDKIDEQAKIRVIGDYDVDGIMSTYILWKGLSSLGADVDTVIPHRVKDGYGISEALIDEAAGDGIDMIITCDNGIAAAKAFEHATDLGITCVITDHHEIPYEEDSGVRRYIIPKVAAVVDPKREDCEYPYKNICGAVVAFRFVQALFDAVGMEEEVLEELKTMAGFATVCDVMELRDENRYLVCNALTSLATGLNVGMRALIKVCGLEGKGLTAYSIGFVLGPCINATGRLDSADLSLQLLQCEHIEDALVIATRLKELNESRKALTQEGLEKAAACIREEDKVLVVYIPELHESLAGIVAGRIRERYYKPVFVVTRGEKELKGSARSIPGYHIYDAMSEIKDVFTKYGGHAMAAGFSLEEDRLEEFRKRINDNCSLSDEDFEEKIVIDVPMPMSYVSEKLIGQIGRMEPFGNGNEKPVFAQKNVHFLSGKLMGKNNNMARFAVRCDDGFASEMVMFRNLEAFAEYIDSKYSKGTYDKLMNSHITEDIALDVIYYPSINEYMGKSSIQFILNDYK